MEGQILWGVHLYHNDAVSECKWKTFCTNLQHSTHPALQANKKKKKNRKTHWQRRVFFLKNFSLTFKSSSQGSIGAERSCQWVFSLRLNNMYISAVKAVHLYCESTQIQIKSLYEYINIPYTVTLLLTLISFSLNKGISWPARKPEVIWFIKIKCQVTDP